MSCVKVLSENFLDPDFLISQTVPSAASGFPGTNLRFSKRRSQVWRSSTVGSAQRFVWDLGLSSNPMAFAAFGVRGSAIQVSPFATIKLEGNETNIWTDPSYSKTLAWDERGLVEASDSGLHTEPLRYWSLSIDDPLNPDNYVELSKVFLGDFETMARGCVEFPFRSAEIDASSVQFSEGGGILSVKKAQSQSFDLSWASLTYADAEALSQVFEEFGTSKPFPILMDSGATFSSSSGYFARIVQFISDPDFQMTNPGVWTFSMKLREVL